MHDGCGHALCYQLAECFESDIGRHLADDILYLYGGKLSVTDVWTYSSGRFAGASVDDRYVVVRHDDSVLARLWTLFADDLLFDEDHDLVMGVETHPGPPCEGREKWVMGGGHRVVESDHHVRYGAVPVQCYGVLPAYTRRKIVSVQVCLSDFWH